jgi:triacylglycerol lipase
MTAPLSPKVVASTADSAYALTNSADMRLVTAAAGEARQQFDIVNGRHFTGVSGVGAPGASSRSNFGYLAFGTGSRQGECLISVRGTATTHDWLTNLHMSGSRGPSGYTVHEGFNSVAASIIAQILAALRNRNPSAIHLVGHSLGGATATILADYLRNTAGIKLYTFGAPRAGSLGQSRFLTSKLGADSIFRVYHDTDVVPMVPIYPFAHLPTTTNQYLLRGNGALVSIAAHGMASYTRSVSDASWRSLDTLQQRRFSLETVDDVLEMASTRGTGNSMLSARLLRLIGQALSLLLGTMTQQVGTLLFVSATVLDQMAAVLAWGAAQSMATARATRALIEMILRFTGRVIVAGANITTAFIRWILQMLYTFIATSARRAISLGPA